MVTVSKNTVYSVFFLILVFISVSVLFIMIGAEFLGMIMLIVYVGAVAVLFLFVVMMLNISEQTTKIHKRKGFINNISVGSIVGVIIAPRINAMTIVCLLYLRRIVWLTIPILDRKNIISGVSKIKPIQNNNEIIMLV